MKAYAKHAYLPEKNKLQPMWADGTILTGDKFPRTGDYGEKGDTFELYQPEGYIMLSYSKAARLTEGDPVIWNMVRHMFIGHGLGDPGESIEAEPDLNLETLETDPDMLVAVLEMQRATGNEKYIKLAERIGDNILNERFHNGYFMDSDEYLYAKYDRHEPLALLLLEAVKRGEPEAVPSYLTGEGVTDGEAIVAGIEGRPSDERIYDMKKSDSDTVIREKGDRDYE